MAEKKYKKESVISGIIKVYESVEKYAIHKGKKKQTIYGRIDNLTDKFIKELKEDGIVIEEFSLEGWNEMKQEIAALRELVINQAKTIQEQQKEIETWRDNFHKSVVLDKNKNKIKG